jgi:hypothetical protein
VASFDDDPFDQEAAKRDYKRQAKASDRTTLAVAEAAYEQGREDSEPTETRSPTPEGTERMDRVRSVPRGNSGKGVSGAGLILGFVGYALLRAWLTEGPAGVRKWGRAKFFNEEGAPGPTAQDKGYTVDTQTTPTPNRPFSYPTPGQAYGATP